MPSPRIPSSRRLILALSFALSNLGGCSGDASLDSPAPTDSSPETRTTEDTRDTSGESGESCYDAPEERLRFVECTGQLQVALETFPHLPPFADPLDADDWLEVLASDPYAEGVELTRLTEDERAPARLGPYVCMGGNHPDDGFRRPRGQPSPPKPKPKRVSYGKAELLVRAQLHPSIGAFAITVEVSRLIDDAEGRDLVERFTWGRNKGYACTMGLIHWTPNMITEEVFIEWRDYWIKLAVTGSLSNLAFESHAIQLLGALADIDRQALRPQLLYAQDHVFHGLDVEPMLAWYAKHHVGDPDPNRGPPHPRAASKLFPVAERPERP